LFLLFCCWLCVAILFLRCLILSVFVSKFLLLILNLLCQDTFRVAVLLEAFSLIFSFCVVSVVALAVVVVAVVVVGFVSCVLG